MAYPSILFGLLGLITLCTAQTPQYVLKDSYTNRNFFQQFQFFTDGDPTGNISYVGAPVANKEGLAGYVADSIYIGVDFQSLNPGGSRSSVRMASSKTYNQGLFIADIAHMPEGCGTWPALWSFGPSWPNNGEIDVVENVNSATTNRVTLHTGPGCTVANSGSATTTQLLDGDCNANEGKDGCSQNTTAAFGSALNAAGGAVWAWEWTTDSVSVWSFPNSSATTASIRDSISKSTAPDRSSWGTPVARFVSGGSPGCDFGKALQNHQLTVNTEICGAWAGADDVWSADPVCSKLAPTCGAYADSRPDAFVEAYWLINSITVFQQGSGGPTRRSVAFTA